MDIPPCVCQPTEFPFRCKRSGCLTQRRAWEFCAGQRCTPLQHEAYARHFAAGKCLGQEQPSPQPPPGLLGPGTILKQLLEKLGIVTMDSCPCRKMQRQMDAWGPTGCRAHRAEILIHLREQFRKATWKTKLAAATKAIRIGLPINPLDPLGWLVDESIRRAELPTAIDPP